MAADVEVVMFDAFDELDDEAAGEHVLDDLGHEVDNISDDFSVIDTATPGFQFLDTHGAKGIHAFKLLEVAQTQIANEQGTDDLSHSEWSLLQMMVGTKFADQAADAYEDCKRRTQHLEELHEMDEAGAWRLTELIHLYENVMLYGARKGLLTREMAPRVLNVLVHDFGEYFGLLCDDVLDSQHDSTARLAQYLAHFRASSLYSQQLPVEKMMRLPMTEPCVKSLLDYEIGRSIPPHPLSVKERILRGLGGKNFEDTNPVEFVTHKLKVQYARDLNADDIPILRAALPVFAAMVFDGFTSLLEAEKYIETRKKQIQREEQQCFALLQCLKHYNGRVPEEMKTFDVAAAKRAARTVYRGKRKKTRSRASVTTLSGMIREKVSGAFEAISRPIAFSWPEDKTVYRLKGYPQDLCFMPQHAVIGEGAGEEKYTFMCHWDGSDDPHGDRPRMFEYEAVIDDGILFDAHRAAQNQFELAPKAFKETLATGRVVLHAKQEVHPGEHTSEIDLEEAKLLGTYVALQGGMQSWIGQLYILSNDGADIFERYPDVQSYVAKHAR